MGIPESIETGRSTVEFSVKFFIYRDLREFMGWLKSLTPEDRSALSVQVPHSTYGGDSLDIVLDREVAQIHQDGSETLVYGEVLIPSEIHRISLGVLDKVPGLRRAFHDVTGTGERSRFLEVCLLLSVPDKLGGLLDDVEADVTAARQEMEKANSEDEYRRCWSVLDTCLRERSRIQTAKACWEDMQ